MQEVVIDKPYTFVPPYAGRFWPWLMQRFIGRRLRREFGMARVDCRGMELLDASRKAGHGILIAPNHCRPCDPLVIGEMVRRAGMFPHTMASWHVFMQGRRQAWLLRRAGAFSVYREGMDRQAVNAAIEILREAKRPLVMFPEGVITRTNDRLNALMEGPTFIARNAAKKRAELSPPGQVVIHPVAIRYHYDGEITAAITPTLEDLERRLAWRPQSNLPMVERIVKVGTALLALKELELLNHPQEGTITERLDRLINHLLVPLEKEWLQGKSDVTVVGRVKKLRAAVLPAMVDGELPEAERNRRWKQFADMYLAQQLSLYPPDYVRADPTAERMLETLERFEEDLTDVCRIYRPMRATVQVGEAIVVSPQRDRSAGEDAVMAGIEQQLQDMIGRSA